MKLYNLMTALLYKYLLILAFIAGTGCSTHLNAQEHVDDPPFFDPVGLMLTWQQDPTTSMTIDWYVIDEDREILEYRELGEDDWSNPVTAESIPFPWSERTIKRVELTGLNPGTYYEFRFGVSSKVYNFRTMPADLSKPVRIAVGGDMMHRQEWMEKTNRQAMKYDPDFILIGGDLAYADGLHPDEQRQRDPQIPRMKNQWYGFLEAYKKTLISEDYRVVPILASIGNHEVRGGYYWRDERRPDDPPYDGTDEWKKLVAPYYFSLFASPGLPGYGVIDFADYMSVLLIDTDHANPVEGEQTEWLDRVLAERQDFQHVFPVYHVPAYPSVRSYNDDVMVKVRENWVPLFEKYGLKLVFEKHDHAYKRTHPIRNGKINPNGIVYVGDGAWGTETRIIGDRQDYDAWYIAEAASVRHFILLTLHGTQRHMKMISSKGEVIDEFPALLTPKE